MQFLLDLELGCSLRPNRGTEVNTSTGKELPPGHEAAFFNTELLGPAQNLHTPT